MKPIRVIFVFFIFLNLSFGQTKTPFLINNELFELPGKWEHIGRIEKSGQYSFSNKKSKLSLLISVRKTEIFEFYKKESTDVEFLNDFYKWETEHWDNDNENVEIEEIEKNETENYVIWRMKILDMNIEAFIMYGVKNEKIIGISLTDNNKKKPKSEIEKIEFLKNIYFKNKSQKITL